jgi:hypothetical protein
MEHKMVSLSTLLLQITIQDIGETKDDISSPLPANLLPGGANYVKTDQSKSSTSELAAVNMDHVLEIVDFPQEIVTEDFERWLEPYKALGYRIKWVDGEHCLIIFRSAIIARDALAKLNHNPYTLQEFSQACEKSKRIMLAKGTFCVLHYVTFL